MVTVYILTYNQAAHIARCLDSVLAQRTDFPLEVLVVDDASTDGTSDIVRRYAREHPGLIRHILNEENLWSQSRSSLVEKMLPAASGEYIAVLDSDDYWTEPTKLQRQVDFLASHPDYSACVHNHRTLNQTGNPALELRGRFRRERDCTADDMLLEHLCQASSLVVRTDALRGDPDLNDVGMQRRFGPYNDAVMFAAALAAGRVRALTGEWSVYRLSEAGVGTAERLEGRDDGPAAHRLFRELDASHRGRFHGLYHDYLYRRRLDEWTFARRRGQRLRAAGILLRAALVRPLYFAGIYLRRYLI